MRLYPDISLRLFLNKIELFLKDTRYILLLYISPQGPLGGQPLEIIELLGSKIGTIEVKTKLEAK